MIAWVIVNIVAPIVLPMIGVLFAKWSLPLTKDQLARANIVSTVQDGQLGWLAVAWSLAAVFEAYEHRVKMGEEQFLWLLGSEFVVVVAGMFLAAGGAVAPRSANEQTRKGFLAKSIIVTLVSAGLFSLVHARTS